MAYRAALPRDEEEAGKAGQNTRRRARGTAGGEPHRAFVLHHPKAAESLRGQGAGLRVEMVSPAEELPQV